mgnify:CR=1 FL=1
MLVKATSAATVVIACAWCSRPLMAQRIGDADERRNRQKTLLAKHL